MVDELAKKAMDKIKNNIEVIANNYFVDTDEITISDGSEKQIKNWKIASMMLGYAMDKNMLLLGEPGWGKTTLASMISCVGSGFPMDLYRKVLIHGHPDQSEEKMIARPDYGALMDKKEKVIWQKSLFFPAIILDEFNRLPKGKQSEWLDQIETSAFSYLNESFYNGDKSFFATVNYTDGGNHKIIPPNLDRFHISLEFNSPGSLYIDEVIEQSDKAEQDLNDHRLSAQIMEIIQDKKSGVEEKIEEMRKRSIKNLESKTDLKIITAEEYQALNEEINNFPYDIDIKSESSTYSSIFMNALTSEFNYTPTFKHKRSCDIRDPSKHAEGLASYCTKNGLSPRGSRSIKDFSKAFALYTGSESLTKAHIEAAAPYCLAHRLQFDEDFKAKHEGDSRETTFEIYCADLLVENISKNFNKALTDYRMLEKFIYNTLENSKEKALKSKDFKKERFKQIMDDYKDGSIDNPLMNEYCEYIKKNIMG